MNKKVFNKLFKDKSKNDQHSKFHPDSNLIDLCIRKFQIQNNEMKDLRKNFDEFISQIRNLTFIIEKLYSCFKTIYEPDWYGNTEFHQSCQQSLKLWRNFLEEFKTNIQKDFEEYIERFPEIKRTIDKSYKKSAEYQRQKSAYESQRNSKKPDIVKTKKAEMEMKYAQDQLEDINNVLKSDLPQFYDSRIQKYIQYWIGLFCMEDKLFQFLREEKQNKVRILNQLNEEASSGKYSILNQVNPNEINTNFVYDKQKATSVMSLFSSDKQNLDNNLTKSGSVWNIASRDSEYDQITLQAKDDSTLNRAQSYAIPKSSIENLDRTDGKIVIDNKSDTIKKKLSFTGAPRSPRRNSGNMVVIMRPSPPILVQDSSDVENDDKDQIYATINSKYKLPVKDVNSSPQSQHSDIRKNINKNVSITLPRNDEIVKSQEKSFYHQVIAKFNYVGQDEDELDLMKDDIILVLPWENEDQTEDGWLYGENIATKMKGLFPENHTYILE